MSKERELLKRVRDTLLKLKGTHSDLCWDIQTVLDHPSLDLREPLSDEEIADLWWNSYVGTADSVRNFARGIEKAHGIGGGE